MAEDKNVGDGPDAVESVRAANKPLAAINGLLDNRLVLLMMAALLGVGGNLAIVSTEPNARADPFTGTEGAALKDRIERLEFEQKTLETRFETYVEEHQRWGIDMGAEHRVRIHELERRVLAIEEAQP